jgi:hypothetical protein
VVASLLAAAVTAQVKGRLANQLQAALEHRWLVEQAKGMLMGREHLDAQAAFERLRRAARSSSRRVADVARDVTAGKPLPLAKRPRNANTHQHDLTERTSPARIAERGMRPGQPGLTAAGPTGSLAGWFRDT